MKLGAFDIGTNTVLMLAVEYAGGGAPRVLADLARITRLGRGVDRSGRLDPQSAASTLATIVEFASAARALGVERFVGVATSALRDATDGAGFIAQVKERAGVSLEIITGETEAALSHLAVLRGLPIDKSAKLLIVDIGGGSTELIRAKPGARLAMLSLQIGSVRLTERIVRSDPPSAAEIVALNAEIDRVLDASLCDPGWNFRPGTMVGIAGTVTTICAVGAGLATAQLGRTHGRTIARTEVDRVRAMFGSLTLENRRKLPGLAEGRADVIFAGACILERVMKRFDAASVIVSDQGVRWGLMWREIGAGP